MTADRPGQPGSLRPGGDGSLRSGQPGSLRPGGEGSLRPGQPGSLRPARRGDLARLAELERAAFDAEAWPLELLGWELAQPARRYLVAHDGHRIVGYGGLALGGREAEITTVAVDPAVRRRGWGRALMNGLIEAARQAGHQAVRLTVAADLEPASALYRGLGFAQVGLAPGYYQPSGRDGVIMRLALTRSRLALTRSPQ